MTDLPWTQAEAIELSRLVERIAPEFGAHVGLTGGLLYKDGPRKDADLLIYRIRQVSAVDWEGLTGAFREIGLVILRDHGFVKKAEFRGKPLDILYPEAVDWIGAPDGRYMIDELQGELQALL